MNINKNENQPMWTFLSHSSADISKVKQVRNQCEDCGMDALMFNLRGLTHGTEEEKKELIKLIRGEIEARDWFILCKSKNTGGTEPGTWKSQWVEEEWNYADKIGKRNKILLDIDNDDSTAITEKIQKLNSLHNIFLSYAHADNELAYTLKRELTLKGFNVLSDSDIPLAEPWFEAVDTQTKNCTLGIVLVTEKTANNYSVQAEIASLLKSGKTILPIFVCEFPNDIHIELLPPALSNICFFVTTADNLAFDAQTNLINAINRLISA